MATGHSIVPITSEILQDKAYTDAFEEYGIFLPENLIYGRFPTKDELRTAIQRLGYQLEEGPDWYVNSEDDHVEIWFSSKSTDLEIADFWFRRGDVITLDILQALDPACGTFAIFPHSGAPAVLIVPPTNFPDVTPNPEDDHFFAVIERRMPVMIQQLEDGAVTQTLFLLSQIRQSLSRADYFSQYSLFQTAQQGFDRYSTLLNHPEAQVRFFVFGLLGMFRERLYTTIDLFREVVQHENHSATKAQMLDVLNPLLEPNTIQNYGREQTQAIWELLTTLIEDPEEAPVVRLAASKLFVHARPGLLTDAIHQVFVDALVQSHLYTQQNEAGHFVVDKVLVAVENVMLQPRIEILLEALPNISYAEDAHDVLRDLLDYVFFGSKRQTTMTSLSDANEAERPSVDPTRFRGGLSTDWLYPANPTKLVAKKLLPFQQDILKTVIALELPWMVHSNLLEKYGLPPTRAVVRQWLDR